jgi:hypothetical protein
MVGILRTATDRPIFPGNDNGSLSEIHSEMKKITFLAAAAVIATATIIGLTIKGHREPGTIPEADDHPSTEQKLESYLKEKESPLAEHTKTLIEQKHWKLIVAISRIESQHCKIQKGFNCWGVGGDHAYRTYENYAEAIKDVNDLIEYWQSEGKWLTPEEMNCSYVVPCNQNWVDVTKAELANIEKAIE